MHCRAPPSWRDSMKDNCLQSSILSQYSLAGAVCQALPLPALLRFLLQFSENGAQLWPTGYTAGKTTTRVSTCVWVQLWQRMLQPCWVCNWLIFAAQAVKGMEGKEVHKLAVLVNLHQQRHQALLLTGASFHFSKSCQGGQDRVGSCPAGSANKEKQYVAVGRHHVPSRLGCCHVRSTGESAPDKHHVAGP